MKNKLHNPGGHEGIRGRKPKFFSIIDTNICEKCKGMRGKFYYMRNGFPTCKYLCINCDKSLINKIVLEEEKREKRLKNKGKSIIDRLLDK